MRFLSKILVVLILASCAKNKSVVGLYGDCDDNGSDCYMIELKADSTFEYFVETELWGKTLVAGT